MLCFHRLRNAVKLRGCVIESFSTSTGPGDPVSVLKAAQRRAAIHTASMVASLFIFVIVVEVLKRRPEQLSRTGTEGDEFGILRIVFYFFAISLVFFTNVVQGLILKATNTNDIGQLASKLTSVNIITTALAETPVLLGLVLFIGWGYHTDFYILGFVSFYLLLRHFPFYGQWEKFAKGRMADRWPSSPVSG